MKRALLVLAVPVAIVVGATALWVLMTVPQNPTAFWDVQAAVWSFLLVSASLFGGVAVVITLVCDWHRL